MCDILLGMKDRKLLSVDELSEYLSIGKTKARELLHGGYGFSVRIGNRWYANKTRLDSWIDRNSI